MGYRTVVVGTDGSATAETAVRHAGRIAGAADARLVVVTAFEDRDDEVAREAPAPEDVRWRLTDRTMAEEKASPRSIAGEGGGRVGRGHPEHARRRGRGRDRHRP